jgi:hypothetical protein
VTLRPAALAVAAVAAVLAVPALAGAASALRAHGGPDPLVFVQAGTVKVWSPDDGHIATIARNAGGDVAVSPDAKHVAWIARDGSLHVVGSDGKSDRRIARGPLGSPLWRSATQLGATRPAGGSSVDAVAFDIASGKETSIARNVESQVFPFGAGVVAKPAPGCATDDLYLGKRQLTKTALDSEVPLDTGAAVGIVAVVRTQASSFQCAPKSVPVPTALRVFQASGAGRTIVSLGKIPATQAVDAAFRSSGTELAYITAKGDLAVRSFLTRKDRIVARGSVSALDW